MISGVVHGLVLAWWASLPEPEPDPEPPPPRWASVELIEPVVAEPVVAPAPEPEPALPDALAPEEPPESEPAEPEPLPPAPSTRPPRSRSPRSPEATPEEPTSEEEPTGPAPGGLALQGLRGSSRADSTRATVRPSLPPPRVDGGHVVRRVGGAGTELPAGSRDGVPRSLAEAGFRRTRGGKMVYTDRRSGFKATLLPDGRLKFRTTVTPSSMPGMSEVIRAAQGQELFQQQKKRLLDETFDLRLRMAMDFAKGNLDRRLKSLYRDLLDRWTDDSSSETRRRS